VAGTLDNRVFDGLIFKLANARERQQALTMRTEVYAADWPATPVDQVVDALDASSHHLVALTADDKSVVA
jgi:hypothetical protein